MTGQPLDDKGRYSQTVVLDGKAYEPKYHPCATTECIRTGTNLDMGDPSTQAYVKALDAQVFKDIGDGATLGSIVTPVGVPGTVLTVIGWVAAGGEAAGSERPSEEAVDEFMKAIAEKGGEAVLRNLLQHTPATAARASALVELSGGWDAFVGRIKQDFFGVERENHGKEN
jgi:hypothetical protein